MDRAKFIIEAVEKIVNPVYLVGGSVRDILLEKEPKDYDFTTPMPPDYVEAKAKEAGRHVYAIGKKFGTIGFKVQDETGNFQYVEVTTFRREKYQAGNRKPEVEFVDSLEDDLSRRDFTINAMALDGNGVYFDPFGGRLHILSRKIKAVGKATDRFREDPLRMLRAARFASQLDFEVDPNMIGMIRKKPQQILTISRERWVQELDKILVAPNFEKGLVMLQLTYLMKYMLPEINLLGREAHAWRQVIEGLTKSPETPDDRWAELLSHVGKGFTMVTDINDPEYAVYRNNEFIAEEVARGIGLRLKFSNARMDTIEAKFKTKKDKNNVSPTADEVHTL